MLARSSTNSSENHTVLICSPAQGVESSGVEVHTTVTTRSTTSQGSDFQHNTARSPPRKAAHEQRRCRSLGASAVAGPRWVRPGRPSPTSVHARPDLGLLRPRSHSPGAAAQLPAPTARRRGLVKSPASPRLVARRHRVTHAKPRLGAQAATWLRGATAGKEPLDRRLRLQPAAAGTAPPSPWLTWKEAGRRGRMQPQILYGGPERPSLLCSAAARWKGVLSSSFLRSRFCLRESKYFSFFPVSPL